MADTGTALYQGQPGTTDTLLYTVPASTTTKVASVRICNTTTSAATIRLTAGTAGAISATKAWFWDFSIAANGVHVLDIAAYLPTTYVIRAQQGTASALTVSIYGIEHV